MVWCWCGVVWCEVVWCGVVKVTAGYNRGNVVDLIDVLNCCRFPKKLRSSLYNGSTSRAMMKEPLCPASPPVVTAKYAFGSGRETFRGFWGSWILRSLCALVWGRPARRNLAGR